MTSKRCILLVDDDADMLGAVRRAVRCADYDIRSTTDPKQAAEWLEKDSFDVIVSDVDMPDLTGHDLMKIAHRACPETIRILLTGAATLESAAKAINEGEVHRYIRKPFDAKSLRETIRQAISRKHELSIATRASRRAQRKHQLLAQLEQEHPGITTVQRDASGAYVCGLHTNGYAGNDPGIREFLTQVNSFE